MKKIAHKAVEFLATGLYSGYLPWFPGTFGTLVGVGVYVLIGRNAVVFYSVLAVLVVLSIWVADYAEKHIFKRKDPSGIVIDEIVGYQITMIFFPFQTDLAGIQAMIFGFILFRIFDIWKPYPIRSLQKIPGGLGIVVDDLLAGVYANLVLQLFRFIGPIVHF